MTFSVYPVLPVWMIALVTLALFVLLGYGSRLLLQKNIARRWIVSLAVLRVCAVLLFLACLLRPVAAYQRTAEKRSDMIVLVDTSQSMGVPPGASGRSRLHELAAAMRNKGLDEHLQQAFHVHWYAFDRQARAIEAKDLSSLEPKGVATDIGAGLTTATVAHQLADSASSQLAATKLLLITDANDHSGSDPVAIASQLGLPIYTLAPADVRSPPSQPSMEFASVEAPRRVLAGSECRFRASVRKGAETAGQVELVEDGKVVATQQVAVGPAEQSIELIHRPTTPGAKNYELRLATKTPGVRVGKPYQVVTDVVGRARPVLLIEDTFRWEFKYLQRVLEDDPSFSVTSFLSRGSGIYMQFAEPDSPVKLSGLPQTASELQWFDIILLGDVVPSRWPSGLAAAINKMVVGEGKSLVVIAGTKIGKLADDTHLANLLPVEITDSTSQPVPGPVTVRLTEGAAATPFYNPAAKSLWSELPPLDQIYAPLRKKPAATVLLDAPQRSNDYGPLIVMAEHTVGRGRALYIGTDTLWKWQMLAQPDESGNTPHRVFWQQALRELAPTRSFDGNVTAWLRPARTRYAAGDTVDLVCEVGGATGTSPPRVEVKIKLPGNREAYPLVLLPDPQRPTMLRGQFQAARPGRYQIATDVLAGTRTVAQAQAMIDVVDAPQELARWENNDILIDRLAAATGGGKVDLDRPDTWPKPSSNKVLQVEERRTVDLWSNFTLVLALVGVLGLDWLLRLLRGFV